MLRQFIIPLRFRYRQNLSSCITAMCIHVPIQCHYLFWQSTWRIMAAVLWHIGRSYVPSPYGPLWAGLGYRYSCQYHLGVLSFQYAFNGNLQVVQTIGYKSSDNPIPACLVQRHNHGPSHPNTLLKVLLALSHKLAVRNLFDPIFTPIELLVGFFNAFWPCLSPAIVGDFLFWAAQAQTDTFAYGAFGTQKQGQKVSLYPFALHLTAQNLTLCKTKN